ncbi:growth/differentiation factor 8-like [Saccostrea cucullata]|uniref:growth/differentiation factor 8-like n=1 Tax=Saccostrea cuccullata TaxID=36930 RepID=UPI002ED0C2B3
MYKMPVNLHSVFHLIIFTVALVFCTVIPQSIDSIEDFQHYDTGNITQEQIMSILSQNTESQSDSDGLNSNRTRCQSCRIREDQKRIRIESIKNRIAHALKLDILGIPNITDLRIPKVPSYQRLRERYDSEQIMSEMQGDAPYSYADQIEDEEDEFGRAERTYIFSEEPSAALDIQTPNAIYFNMPTLENRDVYKALLWVYIAPRSQFNLPKNVSELFLYKMVPPGKHGGPPVKRFMKKRKKSIPRTSGWHHFDITNLAYQWTSDPASNLGVVVEAFDADEENLIILPPTTGINEGYEPNLDLRTTTTAHVRRKRSTGLTCDEQNQFEACCRYPLTVSFIEFGWDFVIAPKWYDAYYCAGECRDEGMSDHGHSSVVQQVPESRIIGNNPGPCCSPVRMANLRMLYFDHTSRLQLTTLPRMKVVRCGCS